MGAQVYIGVDGGGTGCRVVVGTADRILGEGQSGPANMSSDPRSAMRNVLEAIMKASAAAGLREVASVKAHIGLAGIMDSAQADTFARAMPFKHAAVTDDRPTAIAGALGGRDGFVAAIGTGSFIGCKRGADFRFVGGWGLELGDEASAAWLGKTALTKTLSAQDGMQQATELTKAVLARFNRDPNAIIAFAATATPADFGALAPLVTGAAEAGDELAVQLMQDGAGYIIKAFASLNPTRDDRFCLTGGLGPTYARFFTPDFQDALVPAKGTALDGALALARAMT